MPNLLYRATFSGTLAGPEIFSHGLFVEMDNTEPIGTVAAALLDHVANLLATAVSGLGGISTMAAAFPDNVAWTRMTVQEVGVGTGLNIGEPVIADLTDVGAGSAVFGLPNECSMCVSMRFATFGRNKTTRFYLPPFTVVATGGTSRFSSHICEAVSLWLVNESIRFAALTNPLIMGQYSQTHHTFTPVTSTYVGDVVDSQRRRRDALPETRTIDALS